jgi:hypothetical protein
MSLRVALGVVMMTLSAEYLFIVPQVNPASPHAYVPEFALLGAFGVIYAYLGRNEGKTKSP